MRYLIMLLCCVFLFSCKKKEESHNSYEGPKDHVSYFEGTVYRKSVPETGCVISGYPCQCELTTTDNNGYFKVGVTTSAKYYGDVSVSGHSADGMYAFGTTAANGTYNLNHIPVFIIDLHDTSLNSNTTQIKCSDPMPHYYHPNLYPIIAFTKTDGDTSVMLVTGGTQCYILKNDTSYSNPFTNHPFECGANDTLHITINY